MRRVLVVGILSLLTISPLAAAGWGMVGSYEPDTTQDVAGGYTFPNPDITAGGTDKVYFNGWLGIYPVQPTNPNVAAARTAHSATGYRLWAAMGIWKDCNKDGYVGLGENGLFEYRVELLAGDASVCPAGTIPRPIPFGWEPPHNDGQWVHEFIPIAWNRAEAETLGDVDAFNLNDNASRVWADAALPGAGGGAQGCWYNPQPRGTYHNAGGMVEYADCHARWTVTDTSTSVLTTAGLGALSFGDKPRDQSESSTPLNAKPWGEESDGSYVQVWDCSQPQLQSIGVDEANRVNLSAPRVPSVGTSGSLAGTMNATASGFDRCNRRTDANGGTGGAAATLPYANEDDQVNELVKSSADEVFSPYEATRPAAPWQLALGRGAPNNFGLWALQDSGAGTGMLPSGVWMGDVGNYLNGVVLDQTTFEPRPVRYFTYYAFVSPSAVSTYGLHLAKSGTSTYGVEACGATIGPGAPAKNGWTCDPTQWYKDSTGKNVEFGSVYLGPGDCIDPSFGTPTLGVCYGVRPGRAYNLRDIDCYDISATQVREAGVSWGVVTGTSCSSAPGSLLLE